jgi:hypothetical protein
VAQVGRQLPSRASVLKVVLEVGLVATGVFLGLAGDQWREDAQHRHEARASLRRFRAEVSANRDAVLRVRDYHAETLVAVRAYLGAPPATRDTKQFALRGIEPVSFERTAWDLALATQSLAHLDSDVAFALSRLYRAQEAYDRLTGGVTQAMYLRPPRTDFDAFAAAVEVYFSDLVVMEPQLLELYDEALARIEKLLGEG